MKYLLHFLFFSTALVSIVLWPRVQGLLLSQFGILAIVVLMFFIVALKGMRLHIEEVILLFLVVLFFFCSVMGAIFSFGYSGIMTSFAFLLSFLITLSSVKTGYNKVLLKGFFFCAFFSSIWILMDATQFYLLTRTPLIWQVFPITSDPNIIGVPHPFLQLTSLAGIPLYRPCGFSPDPGCSVTAISLAYVLYKERIVTVKERKIYDAIIILAIIVSVSKTSIIALFFYFLFRKFNFLDLREKETHQPLMLKICIILIFVLFFVGLVLPYTGKGNERHLKYFASLVYVPTAELQYVLFGYGLTNTGFFFDNYVPWLMNQEFQLTGAICESTLTNVFLYGGILGSLLWFYVFFLVWKSKDTKVAGIFTILILLSFGYTISGAWFYFVIFSLCFKCIKNQKILREQV
ncbi:MAG: hypothetical protein NC041_05290 [Bacteroides sp.]|nr:hypothetical protein [Prevotella sp.]MCM1407370.1 hypothetical protein [Treponema brennaborense]MCM1469860.1 hypothetical protein [Bacteroides sp.]